MKITIIPAIFPLSAYENLVQLLAEIVEEMNTTSNDQDPSSSGEAIEMET